MRRIDFIFVHTTASWTTATVKSILDYEHNVLQWKNPGYHIIIDRDGGIHRVLPIEQVANGVGAHFNGHGLHVSYIGGIETRKDKAGKVITDKIGKAKLYPVDNRTELQKKALEQVVKEWHNMFPNAEILGHRDAWEKYKYARARKDCPCFDVKAWLKSIGINER